MSREKYDFREHLEVLAPKLKPSTTWQWLRPKVEEGEAGVRKSPAPKSSEALAQEAAAAKRKAEILREWEKLDKTKLITGQLAIRQMPLDTARFLKKQRVPRNIGSCLVTHPFGPRLLTGAMWGYYTRKSEITISEPETIGGIDGFSVTHTGKFDVSGVGLNKSGLEYSFEGLSSSPALAMLETPMYEPNPLTRHSLVTPTFDFDFMQTVLHAVQEGEGGLDTYVAEQCRQAAAPYIKFASDRIHGISPYVR